MKTQKCLFCGREKVPVLPSGYLKPHLVPGPGSVKCFNGIHSRARESFDAHPKRGVEHNDGPFKDLYVGDIIRVIYHEAPTSVMTITDIRAHALIGMDGASECKVTIVGRELRFYAKLSPTRQTVLRDVKLKKVDLENELREVGAIK